MILGLWGLDQKELYFSSSSWPMVNTVISPNLFVCGSLETLCPRPGLCR